MLLWRSIAVLAEFASLVVGFSSERGGCYGTGRLATSGSIISKVNLCLSELSTEEAKLDKNLPWCQKDVRSWIQMPLWYCFGDGELETNGLIKRTAI